MKHSARLVSALAVFTIGSALGCVSTSFTASKTPDGAPLSKVRPEAVKLLTTEPRMAFRTLGEIEADLSGFPSDQSVLKHVRERAASVGANAVIYVSTGSIFMANSSHFTD